MDTRKTTKGKPKAAKGPRKPTAVPTVPEATVAAAKEQVRRELAAWVAAVRVRVEELCHSVREVSAAASNPISLLYGELDISHLRAISLALATADGDLPMLVPKCELTDPAEVARQLKQNWNL